jgi:hypothetical protein
MKKQRIDVKQVCESYNKARTQNVGRKGSSSFMINTLKTFGISGNVARKMIVEPTLFQSFHREGAGRGNYKGYIWPNNPVHISWFQNWLYGDKKEKKDLPFEEECINYLKARGYEIKRCVKFDEDRFAEEHSDLYKKYLVYECI